MVKRASRDPGTDAFSECLLQAARLHEEEVSQLTALRKENAKLQRALAELGSPQRSRSHSPARPCRLGAGVTSATSDDFQPAAALSILPGALQAEVSSPATSPSGAAISRSGSKRKMESPKSRDSAGDQLITLLDDTAESGAGKPHTRSLLNPDSLKQPNEQPPDLPVQAAAKGEVKIHSATNSSSGSDDDEPADRFPLRDKWAVMSQLGTNVSKRETNCTTHVQQFELEVVPNTSGIKRYISYPSSPGRLLWDMAGAILILYDLFAIPLEAFDPPRTDFVTIADWITLLFWTVNIPMSVQVGFVSDGVTIMEFRRIVVHYFTTWFILDFAVVLPDWIFTLTSLGSDDSGGGAGVRLLRTFRLVRLTRLVRLLKLPQIMRSVSELIETEYANILANIAKMIVLLLVINHYVGCLWYLIGKSHDGSDTWVVYHNFADAGWVYKYLTAFHWGVTQFTPASMDVQPQNTVERAYAIIVVVFALVGFSYVVGSITGSLTQLRSLSEDTYKQFWTMRRYLKQNHVRTSLQTRIIRYLEHAWQAQRQTLNLKSSKLFSLLSEQLQSELQHELCLPFLRKHELFSQLSVVAPTSMRRIPLTAMKSNLLAQGDNVFNPGEDATHMYIIVNGCMEYTKADQEDEVPPRHLKNDTEDFISEAVLWTSEWEHLGTLTALKETEVLLLEPGDFSEIVLKSPPARKAAVDYGRLYIEQLNKMEKGQLSDIMPCFSLAKTKALQCRTRSTSLFGQQRMSVYSKSPSSIAAFFSG